MNINNKELVTIYLVPQWKIQSEVNATIESIKNSLSTRILSFINYFRTVTQSNNFVSSLNTNLQMYAFPDDDLLQMVAFFIQYSPKYDSYAKKETISCGTIHSISPVALYLSPTETNSRFGFLWIKPTQNSTLVNGFFTGCSPFEALLKSTLDCLYEHDCLQLLNDYFSSFNQVYIQ